MREYSAVFTSLKSPAEIDYQSISTKTSETLESNHSKLKKPQGMFDPEGERGYASNVFIFSRWGGGGGGGAARTLKPAISDQKSVIVHTLLRA